MSAAAPLPDPVAPDQARLLDAAGPLVGSVVHDLHNLLSVINGYCEILAGQLASQPLPRRQAEEIHAAGKKAAALTGQLLALGRRPPFEPRVLDLSQLVRDHAAILLRLIGEAGQLAIELTPDVALVRTDPAQFQQVLLNLVLNARDALRDRGRVTVATVRRTVRTRRAGGPVPGRYVCLIVCDNGVGMDAQTQRHLFEPFFTTKPEGQGTGLGLALVRGVVTRSGGHITARSELLAGSVFEVLLPETQEKTDEPATAPAAPPPRARGHETVVLIEEDDLVCKMVAGILTADGYRVAAAADAAAARREARALLQAPRLFIGSFTRSGERLARALLAAEPELRVLRACEDGDESAVAWLLPARQAGLRKPYALSEVLKSARALLDAP